MAQFVGGMIFKKPREGAPDFVKGNISIKVAEFKEWFKQNVGPEQEWVNIDLKKSKEGKYYFALNDWKPEKKDVPDDIPF